MHADAQRPENGLPAPRPARPALRYHGGKWQLAPWIVEHFPPHFTYVESYCGAASVFGRKPRSHGEVLNDLDGDIVNFFRVLQRPDQASRLADLLRLTPFAREEWHLAYEAAGDPVERARRLVVRSQMGFGSDSCSVMRSTGFRVNANQRGTTPALDWARYPDCLGFWTERLRGAVIEHKPAIEVQRQHDGRRTLHYVDQPYVLATRNAHRSTYAHDMTDLDHREQAIVLRSLEGMVIVSGYHCPLYDELYGDWHRVDRRVIVFRQNRRVESLWLNRRAAAARPRRLPFFDRPEPVETPTMMTDQELDRLLDESPPSEVRRLARLAILQREAEREANASAARLMDLEREEERIRAEVAAARAEGAERKARADSARADLLGGGDTRPLPPIAAAERNGAEAGPADAPAPADWRSVTVEELMAAIGPAGTAIAVRLRGTDDVGTVGEIGESIATWHSLDIFDLTDTEGRALADALATFGEERGWTVDTEWPHGIPSDWITFGYDDESDGDQTTAAGPRRDPPAAPVPHAREAADANPAPVVLGPDADLAAAQASKARAGDGQPWPDRLDRAGWRIVSRDEWRRTPAADRHPMYRAVKEPTAKEARATFEEPVSPKPLPHRTTARPRRTARARPAGVPPPPISGGSPAAAEAPPARPEFADAPDDADGFSGWDRETLTAAAQTLGVEPAGELTRADRVRVCNRCDAARSPSAGVCPSCRSPEFRLGKRVLEIAEKAAATAGK